MSTTYKKPATTTYQAKNGSIQHKPSIELAMALASNQQGFCLACGTDVHGIEPDARRNTCPECGAHKVYGAEELVLMGLTF